MLFSIILSTCGCFSFFCYKVVFNLCTILICIFVVLFLDVAFPSFTGYCKMHMSSLTPHHSGRGQPSRTKGVQTGATMRRELMSEEQTKVRVDHTPLLFFPF